MKFDIKPAAWMNPKQSFAPDAFIWTRDERSHPEYDTPVYVAEAEPRELSDADIMAIWHTSQTPCQENNWTTGPLMFARSLQAAMKGDTNAA